MNGRGRVNVSAPPAQTRRKDSTMNKIFTMIWKENGTEKSISFDFSYDFAKHILKADVKLKGDSEVLYHSSNHLQSDAWLKDKKNIKQTLIEMVVQNIKELNTLPVAEEIDPEILETAYLVGKVLIRKEEELESFNIPWYHSDDCVDLDLM
jgi:hypothetical protein